MMQVKDRDKIIQFDGELLGHSTSFHKEKPRWAEFAIYRTVSGNYVVSRIGFSHVYHRPGCSFVRKKNQSPAMAAMLDTDSVPCVECVPEVTTDDAKVWPEVPIYWATVCSTADSVVESLAKYDQITGARYWTNTVRDVLAQASTRDDDIKTAYMVESIY